MLQSIDEIEQKVSELSNTGKTILLIRLFEKGHIDFVEVAKSYISHLEKIERKQRGSISSLGLMLAAYCINDKSSGGKNARRHLYESGAWTKNDGTPFGRQLADEFDAEQEPPLTTF